MDLCGRLVDRIFKHFSFKFSYMIYVFMLPYYMIISILLYSDVLSHNNEIILKLVGHWLAGVQLGCNHGYNKSSAIQNIHCHVLATKGQADNMPPPSNGQRGPAKAYKTIGGEF